MYYHLAFHCLYLKLIVFLEYPNMLANYPSTPRRIGVAVVCTQTSITPRIFIAQEATLHFLIQPMLYYHLALHCLYLDLFVCLAYPNMLSTLPLHHALPIFAVVCTQTSITPRIFIAQEATWHF